MTAVAPKRLVVAVVVRVSVIVIALTACYFLAPLNGTVTSSAVGFLVLGLAVVVWLIWWQLRAIGRARHPGVRGASTLALVGAFFLLVFAATYDLLALGTPGAFTEPLSRVDSLYFTVTVFATVGFGDIAPVTQTARIVVTFQMIGDLLVLGVLLRVVVGTVQRSVARRE